MENSADLLELEKRDVREVNTMRTLTQNEMECASGGYVHTDVTHIIQVPYYGGAYRYAHTDVTHITGPDLS